MHKRDAEADEHHLRGRPALLTRDEHLGAGRPFRVNELAVLFDDERAPQWDHHQDAEDRAQDRDGHHADRVHLEAEQAAAPAW